MKVILKRFLSRRKLAKYMKMLTVVILERETGKTRMCLHYVYHNMFREFPRIELHVVNKNVKQDAWVVTRKIQGKIKFSSLFEIINP